MVDYGLETPLLYHEEGNLHLLKKSTIFPHTIITQENKSVNNRELKSPQAQPGESK